MALVRSGNKSKIFEADTKFNSVFDTEYKPGETCEYEGIYKCTGCSKEVTIAGGKTIPPQNHHQHTPAQGNIRWQLFVYAQ
ncbi:protein L [Enterobacter hormaechei]|uniref:protein L n=1 Tax=Enterobacter hormaechei TaxID=158836 RepID=UPI001C63D737|nr:protein L [Enterobacter hormaechei]MBW7649445.1 protein L [Enterobacter hormaechei]